MAEDKAKKKPILLIIVVLAICIIALLTLFWEIIALISQSPINLMNLILSTSTIVLSLYIVSQLMGRSKSLNSETLRVITVLRCESCDYSSAREFEEGDYVLKEVGACPKCNGPLTIYSIFREVKTREKHPE